MRRTEPAAPGCCLTCLRVSGGEGAKLLRRSVAALMAAPPAERRGIVEAIEQRIVELYDVPTAVLHADAEQLGSV